VLSVLTPIDVPSSENVTSPPGIWLPPFETVAEIVTCVRVWTGLWLDDTVVVVGDCRTVMAIADDLPGISFPSPLYTATM
jgi:hypothetical protein